MIVERRDGAADLAFAIEQATGSKRSLVEVTRRVGVSEVYIATAERGAPPVGVGTLAMYGAADHDAPPALAWVGGMAVRPEARRHGAGRALVRAMMERASALGVGALGLDASDMGRPLYEREGFVALGRSSRWARAEPRAEAVTSARHSVHPISVSEAMEIAAFDLPRFGARRMPFLMALLRDFPWHALMARERASGDVSGFIFASERTMGPLVADDDEAAAALLSACEISGAPTRIIVMDDDARATKLLAAAGYAPDGVACTRMTLGARALPGRRESVLGAATWALG